LLFFAYFSVSEKQNIKWSPNRMKPSGTRFSHQIRPRRLGPSVKKATRRSRGWRTRPLPRGPLKAPPTYSFLLYIPMYPQTIRYRAKKPNSTAVTFCIHEIPSWGLFRSSAGRGIDHGGLLHHHPSPSDEV